MTIPAAVVTGVPSLAALVPMDVASRLDRLRSLLPDAECDAILVTKLVNIRYLTGFTGSAALLFVTADDTLFVSDGRYGEQAAEQLAAARVTANIEISGTGQKDIVSGAAAGVARVGLEADAVTWAAQRVYADDWFPSAELVATAGLVAGLRLTKDDGEQHRIAAAATIADTALATVARRLLDGPTEADFGLELDTEMRRLGATAPSFETIVATGPNGAMPHHRPGSRRVAPGDLVVVDFGALVDGYCSDMTRTVMVGEPTAMQRRMYDVVAESQAAGVDAVTAGVEARAVDQACRDVITTAGWGDAFLHSTGHGVGLEIHEDPRVAHTSTATLTAGCVVTVEPGVYLPEHGGVRIEDTLIVTADGSQTVTLADKQLVIG